MSDTQTTFHARLNGWLDLLDRISPEGYAYAIDPPRKGQRYARVVMSINGGDRSVHAFYDLRTGDVYKAEGWKKPAKGVRFNLLDDESFANLLEQAHWTGRYLYARGPLTGWRES